jgi:hypothetical protein
MNLIIFLLNKSLGFIIGGILFAIGCLYTILACRNNEASYESLKEVNNKIIFIAFNLIISNLMLQLRQQNEFYTYYFFIFFLQFRILFFIYIILKDLSEGKF